MALINTWLPLIWDFDPMIASRKMASDWGFRFHDCLYGNNFGACSMITSKNGSQKMVQENGEKRARKENGTRNNTDSCWCFFLVLTGFSTMIIDKHWGPSCQASDPWRQNGLRVWGHTLFLRASRSSWSFPNMFHSSRGAGCPCIPAQRRGLHATLIPVVPHKAVAEVSKIGNL